MSSPVRFISTTEGTSEGWIPLGIPGGVSRGDADALQAYLETIALNQGVLERRAHGIRFINYCGLIRVNGTIIEILPKLGPKLESTARQRAQFLRILNYAGLLEAKVTETGLTELSKEPLHILLARLYADILSRELRKGPYRAYREQEEALIILRGRANLLSRLRYQTTGSLKTDCRFDEFTIDNPLNQYLAGAIKLLRVLGGSAAGGPQLQFCESILSDATDIPISDLRRMEISLDRFSQRFRPALGLAEIVIRNFGLTGYAGSSDSFSLLFEMNLVFERFVTRLLTEATTLKVAAQEKCHWLLYSGKRQNHYRLRPDLVVRRADGRLVCLADAKWKKSAGIGDIQNADQLQMYAYGMRYKQEATSPDDLPVCLIYPSAGILNQGVEPGVLRLHGYPGIHIRTRHIRIDTLENAREDAREFLRTVSADPPVDLNVFPEKAVEMENGKSASMGGF